MDYNKIIQIKDILPRVNMANYFTLKEVSSWGPRVLPDFELILIRKGNFLYECLSSTDPLHRERTDSETELGPGDVLIIPPGENHRFYARQEEGAISCIHCLPRTDLPWESPLVRLHPQPSSRTSFTEEIDLMDGLFRKCSDLFEGYNNYRDELMGTVCREIWLLCASQWEMRNQPVSPRMQAMILFIQEHCTQTLTRQDLSNRFNLSPEYINALFKKELGLTPTECIHRERILLAYEALHRDGLNVSETAYKCGFKDPFYFSRVFKKILGIAPETVMRRKYFQ
ncbi:AraC family transcriptional regulator [Oceanispirochaeta sp.]|jgi:AraC-like DNA-binding protein|uniref:helix-turn-helix domain-containing protein n=1 Tax=Oceanispirochaeta sp. TaxID=2035350 RepID=UPI0026343B8B|nr:AraC family transcriptional regulator [Oceanispirochaeta sp.]MDA3955982.1 AraC family transcriptional regulator [Oceanispirochaeta sp.]